eukprot:CAMPEP_0116830738 /NCGR_PEP_ID=MMETSP0418-20121206/4933_1 /TAXON_ID=1158023 /ORGANISM="Astrosyne radiata, Strain 13vi08-1A" /LENGTH=71 /DNA_ID=CAMNT_0004459881 /DNA_START=243 /DNA_END=455 /DNA_ORIENTATION=+
MASTLREEISSYSSMGMVSTRTPFLRHGAFCPRWYFQSALVRSDPNEAMGLLQGRPVWQKDSRKCASSGCF